MSLGERYFGIGQGDRGAVLEALRAKYGTDAVMDARSKGGFFVKGVGFLSLAKARTQLGIAAEKREPRPAGAWGDFATMRAFAQTRVGKAGKP